MRLHFLQRQVREKLKGRQRQFVTERVEDIQQIHYRRHANHHDDLGLWLGGQVHV